MENKIKVRICVGTYCYVMGGHELKEIKNKLPDDLRDKVYVEASLCLGCDNIKANPEPPYAEINGKLMEKATIEKIVAELRNLLNQ